MKRQSDIPHCKEVLLNKYDPGLLISPYQKSFIGYSLNEKHRLMGSSGGVGSELAYFVLEADLVNLVVGVGYSERDPTLPEYRIIENPREVHSIAGSKYVYMEFESLLQLLHLHRQTTIAVFVQPCFVGAIRAYQKHSYRNIKYIFSFFCGYNITYEGTKYFIDKTKISKGKIDSIAYRGGRYPAGFTVKSKDGEIVSYGKEYYELIDLMFLRKGCKDCTYYMGEGADVALGDAWVRNLQKASVIITRTNEGSKLVNRMYLENKIKLYQLEECDLIRMHWHNLRFKKFGLGPFLNLMHTILKIPLVQKIIPFKFVAFFLRLRRKIFIGIKINLNEIKTES